MKKGLVFLLIVLMIGFSGCSFIRRSALKVSKEDLKNAEVAREIAKNCLSTWPINSSFIKGAMGSSLDKLPLDAIKAMTELDVMADIEGELTDSQVGYTLGLKVRFYTGLIKEALKQYAPNVLKLLPFALP